MFNNSIAILNGKNQEIMKVSKDDDLHWILSDIFQRFGTKTDSGYQIQLEDSKPPAYRLIKNGTPENVLQPFKNESKILVGEC